MIRILDQNKMSLDISMLGFSKENEELFKKLINRPQGMILITGPTGSGKSTSLYAAVSELNTKDRCIITFEDPVEYRVPGIVQVQINPAMNVTFPQALKSGLRQDIELSSLSCTVGLCLSILYIIVCTHRCVLICTAGSYLLDVCCPDVFLF